MKLFLILAAAIALGLTSVMANGEDIVITPDAQGIMQIRNNA